VVDKAKLLLALALNQEHTEKVQKLPKLDRSGKEGEIVRRGYRQNGMNNPGRS
jgi:hypothetical protein